MGGRGDGWRGGNSERCLKYWLSSRNFFRGGKSIVMQISIVILLFSGQISGRRKFSGGCPLPPVEESQSRVVGS